MTTHNINFVPSIAQPWWELGERYYVASRSSRVDSRAADYLHQVQQTGDDYLGVVSKPSISTYEDSIVIDALSLRIQPLLLLSQCSAFPFMEAANILSIFKRGAYCVSITELLRQQRKGVLRGTGSTYHIRVNIEYTEQLTPELIKTRAINAYQSLLGE